MSGQSGAIRVVWYDWAVWDGWDGCGKSVHLQVLRNLPCCSPRKCFVRAALLLCTQMFCGNILKCYTCGWADWDMCVT